jgi:lipopolysaccharide assembly outer membrane protein LptD (OstA)
VPTFSLDSGVVFERDASYFGRSFRQTLEPRAFYVYTPYRNQSLLPNYDSAVQRLQLRHHLHRERLWRATTASPTTTC